MVEQVKQVLSHLTQVVPPSGVKPASQAALQVVPCKKGRPVSACVYHDWHVSLFVVNHVLQGKLHCSCGTSPLSIVSILKSAFVKVERVKLEVLDEVGFLIPSIWKVTCVVTDVVVLNPLSIVNVLDPVLWLVVQSKTLPEGIPPRPVQVIEVGTVTVLG